MKLSPGRVVMFRISDTEVRPATVVKVWSDTCANLQIMLDGDGDKNSFDRHGNYLFDLSECDKGLVHRTSIVQGDDIGEWQWPVMAH